MHIWDRYVRMFNVRGPTVASRHVLVSVLKYECCLRVPLSAGSHTHTASDSASVQRQDTGLSTGLPALILLVHRLTI